jgi:threonylcarbamoyladenosine tRNA methylthiotransferase MtaB
MSPGVSRQICAAVFTLGCRLNQADTALLCADLAQHGYRLVPWGTPAELLVVNGCTVTSEAAAKTRKAVHAGRRRCPQAFIVVVGCASELEPSAWATDGQADLIVGTVGKTRLSQILPTPLQRPVQPVVRRGSLPARDHTVPSFGEVGVGLYPARTRANLKIQEGCDFHCSYCIVPQVRGPARSRQWADTLREAEELRRRGHREIVLAGVNIATYADGGRDLADLIEAILALGPGFRLRLGSTEPGPVLRRVVSLMAREPRLCRFLHLPLQYGEDTILRAMNRRYTVAEFADLANLAAAAVPGLCLGSDIIVGFPGETDARFRACVETVKRLPVNHLHVFTFSPRQGTPAATMPGTVPGDLAAARAAELTRLGRLQAEAFARAQVGQTLHIITETRSSDGTWEGWSDNYLRVEVPDAPERAVNQWLSVHIEAHLGGRRLRGTPAQQADAGP